MILFFPIRFRLQWFSILLLLGSSTSVFAEEKKTFKEPDRAIIEAYQKLGARYGTLDTNQFHSTQFREKKPGETEGSVPAFQFRKFPVQGLPKMEVPFGLMLDGRTGLTDKGLKELKQFPQLTHLCLFGTQITDEGLKELKQFPQLTHLDLCNHREVTDKGLEELKDLKQLTSLNLAETSVTDSGMVDIKELQQLRYLNLTYTRVTAAGLKE
jgi:hypothetical protein